MSVAEMPRAQMLYYMYDPSTTPHRAGLAGLEAQAEFPLHQDLKPVAAVVVASIHRETDNQCR